MNKNYHLINSKWRNVFWRNNVFKSYNKYNTYSICNTCNTCNKCNRFIWYTIHSERFSVPETHEVLQCSSLTLEPGWHHVPHPHAMDWWSSPMERSSMLLTGKLWPLMGKSPLFFNGKLWKIETENYHSFLNEETMENSLCVQ